MNLESNYQYLLELSDELTQLKFRPSLMIVLGDHIESFYDKNNAAFKVASTTINALLDKHVQAFCGIFLTTTKNGHTNWVFKTPEDKKIFDSAYTQFISTPCQIFF